MKGITYYARKTPCPVCSMPLDAATQLKGMARPRPGDVTICFECEALLLFDEPPSMHVMTDLELASLGEDEYEALRFAKRQLEAFKRGPA